MTPQPKILALHVNGTPRPVLAEPNTILLDALREGLHLTGTKRGCDLGTCGCCTVLIDGEARLSCLTLAAHAVGKKIETIEGLGSPGALHPIQAAFSDVGGSQCGFCTPGFIMTTKALLAENPEPDMVAKREALSGNLCRCTGYIKIFEAVDTAAKQLRGARSPTSKVPVMTKPAKRKVKA